MPTPTSVPTSGLIVDEQPHLIGPSSTATFSPDRRHRYALTRWWADEPPAVFVMLNPSTADAFLVDPTVRRCIGFAKAWGCGGLIVVNVFGLRSTDPAALRRHADPIGPDNDAVIKHELTCRPGGPVVAAWGAHAAYLDRGRVVAGLLDHLGVQPQCLALTKDGHPRHPLYLRAESQPQPFAGQAVAA
jgi:hypothetical protein